jgi:hypothetical protein
VEYYKKIDKSALRYGITIPNQHIETFMHGKKLKPKESRIVDLYWKGKRKKFKAKMEYRQYKSGQKVLAVLWDNNRDFLLEIRKEFIQSFLAIESKNYESKINDKYYRTDLQGGNQEVLIFRSKSPTEIELETFIKVKTPYEAIFKRLVDDDVFAWLSRDDKEYLITKSTKWYDIKDLKKHEDREYVIYYLIDEGNKEIYIGSTIKLRKRVIPGREEIPGWSKFRYDIVHPKYRNLLQAIEFQMIRAFANFFENNGKTSFFCVSKYKLVNKSWPKR